jgi:hypothetical protein
MADFQYMIIGVTKAETGSMDAYFNSKINSGDYDFAYIGCPSGSGIVPSWFTWPTGSKSNTNDKDAQMYTPYPTSTVRGKLYWIGTGSFETDYPNIPNRTEFVNLNIPSSGSYYIITPSLTNALFNNAGQLVISQYAFIDENDLWDNGWKSQTGFPGASNPLATQANWEAITKNPSWTNPPLNFITDGSVPGDRAQIVANVLALTNNSINVQTSVGNTPIIKGAIVLAGLLTPFDNDTYRNLVPLKN